MDQKKMGEKCADSQAGVPRNTRVRTGTQSCCCLRQALHVQPWSRARSVQFCEYHSLIIWLNTLWRKRIKSLWIESHCVLNERCMARKRILLCVIFKAWEHFMMCICRLRYEKCGQEMPHQAHKRDFSKKERGKGAEQGTEHGFNSYAVFFLLRTDLSQEWWPVTAIPALGRKRQESKEFKTSLTYILSLTAAISSENRRAWLSWGPVSEN